MNPRLRVGILALVSAFFLFLPLSAFAVGEPVPDFSLKDLKGGTVRLGDHAGKNVMVISFWATWCQPCQAEMPHLEALYKENKDKGFTVLSINTDEARNHALVKSIVQQKGFTFPVLLDQNTQVIAQFNPRGMIPYTVVVGKDGRIKSVHTGYTPGDEVKLRAEVEAELSLGATAPLPSPSTP